MTYRIDIAPSARREIEAFVEHMRSFDTTIAEEQLARLSFEIGTYILATPRLWNYFFISGAPYHGYLFRFGQKHHYWIVYSIDEDANTVNILRFWNTNRDPDTFGL
ncbi:MAG: type II toxin-antitoxin system RelE/ParE family toxin [Patescibacteria group bacterium]